jgi:hypothetical protein
MIKSLAIKSDLSELIAIVATIIAKVGIFIHRGRKVYPIIIVNFLGKKFDEPTWENQFDASFTTPTNNAVLSLDIIAGYGLGIGITVSCDV